MPETVNSDRFKAGPFGDSFQVKYNLKLHFEDRALYKRLENVLYNNKEHVIVIAGKWKSTGDV